LKKIIFLLILVLGFSTVFFSSNQRQVMVGVKLYFVDSEMLRLLPVEIYISDTTPQKKAQAVLDELIRGRDDNPKIRRTIPNIKNGMTVKVENNTAYVDISKKMVETHPEGRELELLTIYSIVNSLTGIEGISTVRFTINHEIAKDFMGYVDMRETFIPDYFM
jgi:spore germination protein GerM